MNTIDICSIELFFAISLYFAIFLIVSLIINIFCINTSISLPGEKAHSGSADIAEI